MSQQSNRLLWILIPIFILAGIGLRILGLKFESGDLRYFVLRWYDTLATNGFAALREPFSNYTPPYLYLLFFVTKTAGFIPRIIGIKLLSILFDLLNAFWIYKIIKIRFPQGAAPWIGASLFLLLPTVIMNSAYWGQCDSIYAFFLLACLFFVIKDRPWLAMTMLGISFAIKAQAFFFAPLVLLLIVKKRIPWFTLGVIPLVYALLMSPAALTGRPFFDLLTVYASQEEKYSFLSLHAPNWYLLFPAKLDTPEMVLFGLIVTCIIVLVWVIVYAGKIKEFTPPAILLCALMSVALMPFFLPKMHERYFYLADIISLLMAFYFSRGWLLTVGYQLTSGLSYSIFLLTPMIHPKPIVAADLLISALFINIALMGFIFSYPWKLMNGDVIKADDI